MNDVELNKIIEILEDLKAVLLLTNDEQIQSIKKQLLEKSAEQKRIYDLCDSKTTEEIATSSKKQVQYVNSNLSRLRQKGLIKTVERNGKKVHEQRF